MIDLKTAEVLSSAIVGWEFELYCNRDRKKMAAELSALVGKKVKVGNRYHGNTEVDPDQWKLEPDFSGGVMMHELITGPMPYQESLAVAIKLLTWIRKNGWTDEKCACQLNVSFDRKLARGIPRLEAINRLKFVLSFDENYIYERFPARKNSIYARSISRIIPTNLFATASSACHDPSAYELPYDKFYGVNFTKLASGYLEFRYAGGRGYEKKPQEIREVLDYCVTFMRSTLEENGQLSPEEQGKLTSAVQEHRRVAGAFSDPRKFVSAYPNVKVFVDLKGDMQVLSTYWVAIREKLFTLIVSCGLRKGYFNYDSDVSKFQLKDAYVPEAFPVEGLELIGCRIRGNVVGCDLYNCAIGGSHVVDCNIWRGNVIQNSKIITSPIHIGNDIQSCYIDNRDCVISGDVVGGIIRSGDVTELADVQGAERVDQIIGAGGKSDGKKGKGGVSFDGAGKKAPGKGGQGKGYGKSVSSKEEAGYFGMTRIGIEKKK